MKPILTKAEYNKKSKDYRGTVDGKPYLVYMDENGATVYGPVIIAEIENLTCCCCTGPAKGRQWYNRDTGYGLCPKCAQWIATKESPEQMRENYGEPGIHYFTSEQ
jgi:hypothetical protein